MASELSRDALRRLARIGAARRLEELRQEEAALLAAFPDLEIAPVTRRRRGRPRRSAETASVSKPAPSAPKRSYKMTAAQKRAVSLRMKKYWAGRRKAEG